MEHPDFFINVSNKFSSVHIEKEQKIFLTLLVNSITVCLNSTIVSSRRLNCPHVGHCVSACGHWFKYPYGPVAI